MNLLELRGIGMEYGAIRALADVDYTVARGEIVGLIGANGSGKTTLLNVINGLDPIDQGAILLDGRHLERLPAHAIARMGIARTFQAAMLAGDSKSANLARALARGGSLLLLDEPAAGLADEERRELAVLLRQLRTQDYGVLIVDHDIELLSAVCDRLVCLDRGRIIAAGSPAEVRADAHVRASFLGLAEAA